jgi:hypothetical protein
VCALEKFVAMDRIMFFQTGPIVENFATGIQGTTENFGLLVRRAACGSSANHASGSFFEEGIA